MTKWSTRVAYLLVLPILFCILTACDERPREWVTNEEAKAEYYDEATKLELAPGWTWPNDPGYSDKAPDGARTLYGVNTGRVDAAWYWHCSWARTYFAAATQTAREAAFVQVMRLRESAFYHFGLLPPDRTARDRVLDAAAAGDLTALREIIEVNCPKGPN